MGRLLKVFTDCPNRHVAFALAFEEDKHLRTAGLNFLHDHSGKLFTKQCITLQDVDSGDGDVEPADPVNEEISPLQDHASKAEINVADLSRKDHKLMRVIEQVRNERVGLAGTALDTEFDAEAMDLCSVPLPGPKQTVDLMHTRFSDAEIFLEHCTTDVMGADGVPNMVISGDPCAEAELDAVIKYLLKSSQITYSGSWCPKTEALSSDMMEGCLGLLNQLKGAAGGGPAAPEEAAPQPKKTPRPKKGAAKPKAAPAPTEPLPKTLPKKRKGQAPSDAESVPSTAIDPSKAAKTGDLDGAEVDAMPNYTWDDLSEVMRDFDATEEEARKVLLELCGPEPKTADGDKKGHKRLRPLVEEPARAAPAVPPKRVRGKSADEASAEAKKSALIEETPEEHSQAATDGEEVPAPEPVPTGRESEFPGSMRQEVNPLGPSASQAGMEELQAKILQLEAANARLEEEKSARLQMALHAPPHMKGKIAAAPLPPQDVAVPVPPKSGAPGDPDEPADGGYVGYFMEGEEEEEGDDDPEVVPPPPKPVAKEEPPSTVAKINSSTHRKEYMRLSRMMNSRQDLPAMSGLWNGTPAEDRNKLLEQWINNNENPTACEAAVVLSREEMQLKIESIIRRGQGLKDPDAPADPASVQFWVTDKMKLENTTTLTQSHHLQLRGNAGSAGGSSVAAKSKPKAKPKAKGKVQQQEQQTTAEMRDNTRNQLKRELNAANMVILDLPAQNGLRGQLEDFKTQYEDILDKNAREQHFYGGAQKRAACLDCELDFITLPLVQAMVDAGYLDILVDFADHRSYWENMMKESVGCVAQPKGTVETQQISIWHTPTLVAIGALPCIKISPLMHQTVTPGLIAGAALGLLLYHRADASAFALWSGSVRRWHAAQASASVHAMTMEEGRSDTPRRRLADFQLGEDLVDAVVTRDTPSAVHLEIGAAVDGILEKGETIGLADPLASYWPGQRLNVTVIKKAKHHVWVRLQRYDATRCHSCFQPLEGHPAPGSRHELRCQCVNIGRHVPPFFEDAGHRYHGIVGPVPLEVQEKMQKLIEKGNQYWDTWTDKSSRPTHKGRLHGVGLQLSRNITFPGTEQLQEQCNEVLREMLGTSMVQLLRNASNADVWRSFRWYTPPSLPAAQPGVAERDGEGGTVQSYIGQGYMAVLNNCSEAHGPPVPVAKLLGVPSCKDTCPTCRSQGCQACSECCVHVDNDQSASVLLGIQEENPLIDEMAFFVMGNKAFPLAGGRSFFFDGKVVPHGVWRPQRGHYKGMAFVRKALGAALAAAEAAKLDEAPEVARCRKRVQDLKLQMPLCEAMRAVLGSKDIPQARQLLQMLQQAGLEPDSPTWLADLQGGQLQAQLLELVEAVTPLVTRGNVKAKAPRRESQEDLLVSGIFIVSTSLGEHEDIHKTSGLSHAQAVAELAEAWALWALEPSDADASDLRLRSATAAERLRGTVLHEELRQVAEMPGDAASHEHLTSHAERATQRLRQVADTLRHTAPVDALPAATAVLDSHDVEALRGALLRLAEERDEFHRSLEVSHLEGIRTPWWPISCDKWSSCKGHWHESA
ncbi:unnamed protein product [Durusdinium trenchii]|uniref:Uncharacterized protein n=1 Tax=Durusdinium trenchii TaxID=1381693 RepID=A0ABP0I1Y5_9DINO